MTTIYTLIGADFRNTDLPNIFPFVAKNELEFAYDFGHGVESLKDLSGNDRNAIAMLNDLNSAIRKKDDSILVSANGGKGIRVELGYIDTQIPIRPTKLTDEFTVMLVGGYMGEAFPANKLKPAVAAPTFASLLDFGTNIGGNSFGFESYKTLMGVKVKYGEPNLISNHTGAAALFLTRKSGVWTLRDMTNNRTVSKTNAELGITGDLGVYMQGRVSTVVIGFYETMTMLNALYPTIYQAARWNRPLTDAEIEQQYAKTKRDKDNLV